MATQINPHTANQIRGVILQTVADSANRDDLWKLADELANNITMWLQLSDHIADARKMVSEQVRPIYRKAFEQATAPKYQTGKTTNPKTAAWLKSIDAELDAPQATPVPDTEPAQPEPTTDTDELESVEIAPIWTEWEINWNQYDLARYSNPCASKNADGTIRYIETELWLISRESGELKTCDARFNAEADLRAYCDPLIAAYENNRPEYNAAARKKSRLDQFVDLWEQYPGQYKRIAEIMGVSVQTVYSYKNLSKARV